MKWLDTLRLLRAMWAVYRGRAERISAPGKWYVWREGPLIIVDPKP